MEDFAENLARDRAFIEINLKNLQHNINEIKSIINYNTKIMAVVKANAYGHGICEVSKYLESIGITDFAVATLEEGITLRNSGITGNILILGYTDFSNLEYVIKYNLIQTIVDYNYSNTISKMVLSNKIKAHVKINTGMNRLGEKSTNIDNIIKIFENKNLNILGCFSHLSVADSNSFDDIEYTNTQIDNFMKCINTLKDKNYNVGKIHLQSSYGILNYNNLNLDYVRCGIIMYGVDSTKNSYSKIKLDLKRVLSLKARITCIKEIEENESVSYGRTYIAKEKRKIATVAIGYADGYPRLLQNSGIMVKVNNNYAPVIGRICMDQLMIDITNIKNVNVGDIITLIGSDEPISAENLAEKTSTITNELLSRLGPRLTRITKQ